MGALSILSDKVGPWGPCVGDEVIIRTCRPPIMKKQSGGSWAEEKADNDIFRASRFYLEIHDHPAT